MSDFVNPPGYRDEQTQNAMVYTPHGAFPAMTPQYAREKIGEAEVGMTIGSGIYGAWESGWAGLASGGDTELMGKVQEARTYMPRTPEGQRRLGTLGAGMERVGNALVPYREKYEAVANKWLPLPIAAGLYAATAAALEVVGPRKGTGRGVNALVDAYPNMRGGPPVDINKNKLAEIEAMLEKIDANHALVDDYVKQFIGPTTGQGDPIGRRFFTSNVVINDGKPRFDDPALVNRIREVAFQHGIPPEKLMDDIMELRLQYEGSQRARNALDMEYNNIDLQYRSKGQGYENPDVTTDEAAKLGATPIGGKRYYRAPGFEGGPPRGWTARQIVEAEAERGWIDPDKLTPELLKELEGMPAEDLKWVAKDADYLWSEFGPDDSTGWRGLIEDKADIEDITDALKQEGWEELPINAEADQILMIRRGGTRSAVRSSAKALHDEFINRGDDFWGILDEGEGSMFKESGYSGVQCTGYACEIQSRLGADRVKVMGYDADANKNALLGQGSDGHDFALVDDRYIVDPWITDVEDLGKGVYDLKNPGDAAEVKRLYGDQSTWKPQGETFGGTRSGFDPKMRGNLGDPSKSPDVHAAAARVAGRSSLVLGNKTYVPQRTDRGAQVVTLTRDEFDELLGGTNSMVGPGPGYENQIGDRIKRFQDFWEKNDTIEVGNLYINDDGKTVYGSFSDGRHRARVMYESGMREIPVSMDKASIEKLDHWRAGRHPAKPTIEGAHNRPGSRVGAASVDRPEPGRTTIQGAQRKAYPGIYSNPREIAQFIEHTKVAPENPMLYRLFGVTRRDLAAAADKPGTAPGVIPGAAQNPKGSRAVEQIMKPANTRRLVNLLDAAQEYAPNLYIGMKGWYIMDPAYHRILYLTRNNEKEAMRLYTQLNHLSGMASPGSEVISELKRGTAANMLHEQGRFSEFLEHGGRPEPLRIVQGLPEDLTTFPGHPYHSTAHGKPMLNYLTEGRLPDSPKVPLYIQGSEASVIGRQTDIPVGDAHYSRGVGLGDTRTSKGYGASVSTAEIQQLAPWWREEIARQAGLESVPAQAIQWGLLSDATGVTTPVGAPKLEILAGLMDDTARRLKISPEEARDRVLLAQAQAGFADPKMLAMLVPPTVLTAILGSKNAMNDNAD